MITLTETLKPYCVKYKMGYMWQIYLVMAENDQSAEDKARKALNKKRVQMTVEKDSKYDGWIL